ncbi:MAG: PQQ-binding-like beta-propeller repeat protein [Planctomycetaceae bacterium]|nr:PQQ-binding-like beta-propeller repeat protein [Planctomycetaceae bacterium]
MRTVTAVCFLAVIGSLTSEQLAGKEPSETVAPIQTSRSDWPWWRGPARNGIAPAGQEPPTEWGPDQNILWKASVPGRGHGSATIVDDEVFLTAADAQTETQSVMCFNRMTGEVLWSTTVHQGGFPSPDDKKANGNEKASWASTTIACDGRLIFVNFLNNKAVFTTALTRDGKQVWQTKISDYVVHQGYGSSPALYEDLVIVSADNKGGGAIAALNRGTGDVVWRRERPAKPNYASPTILNVCGKDQLLFTGCDLVTSLDPLTGEVNWEVEGATTECVTTTVTDGQHIFTSGGYPRNHISAVAGDGSGRVVWENNTRTYVPSMLVKDGFLYAILDAGVATCRRADTGEEIWKGRLAGTFSSSPVLVNDKIYVINEEGTAFIFAANPAKFELLNSCRLGDSVFATPTICGGRIYIRIAHMEDGQRKEYLYCLGHSAD